MQCRRCGKKKKLMLLGHRSPANRIGSGVRYVSNTDMSPKMACLCNVAFNSFVSYSTSSFDLIHADICGPYSTPSLNGFKCFLTFVDDYSRCT